MNFLFMCLNFFLFYGFFVFLLWARNKEINNKLKTFDKDIVKMIKKNYKASLLRRYCLYLNKTTLFSNNNYPDRFYMGKSKLEPYWKNKNNVFNKSGLLLRERKNLTVNLSTFIRVFLINIIFLYGLFLSFLNNNFTFFFSFFIVFLMAEDVFQKLKETILEEFFNGFYIIKRNKIKKYFDVSSFFIENIEYVRFKFEFKAGFGFNYLSNYPIVKFKDYKEVYFGKKDILYFLKDNSLTMEKLTIEEFFLFKINFLKEDLK